MASLWRTRNGLWQLRLGWWQLLRRLGEEDFRDNVVELGRSLGRLLGIFSVLKRLGQRANVVAPRDWDGSPHQSSAERRAATFRYLSAAGSAPHTGSSAGERPLIFASCCVDESPGSGGWRYSGGVKELNFLVRLLLRHGYEAWVVTSDGTYVPWLAEHAPHLSLLEYREKLRSGRPVRCVTSYAIAAAFIDPAPRIYFWDMELALTENEHLPLLARYYNSGKIAAAAGISRTIQAWHMARFARPCLTLAALEDDAIYRPSPEARQAGRVGYMNEGDHTEQYVEFLRAYCAREGVALTFERIAGPEVDYAAALQACDFYLSMNLGKDLLWGEGCPLTVSESLACGCVLLAFDVIGNREIIVDGFNAVLLPRYRVDLMGQALVRLARDSCERERLRTNALSLAATCHKLEDRWPVVREFLQLP